MGYTKLNKGEKSLLYSLIKFEKFLIENNIRVFTDSYEELYLELLPFVKEFDGKLYTSNILLKNRYGSCSRGDIYFSGGLVIKNMEGFNLVINYEINYYEKGGHLLNDKCESEIVFDYHTEEMHFKKRLREDKTCYSRKWHDDSFFDSEFKVEVLNGCDICFEPCEYGERYSLEKDGLVHCYIDHFDCYYDFFTQDMEIKNSDTGNIVRYFNFEKYGCRSEAVYKSLKKNNSPLDVSDLGKIEENLEKLQLELSVVDSLNEEILCQLADTISELIENCDFSTFKQSLDDEILCRALRKYSDDQLERVLEKRKGKVKKI